MLVNKHLKQLQEKISTEKKRFKFIIRIHMNRQREEGEQHTAHDSRFGHR